MTTTSVTPSWINEITTSRLERNPHPIYERLHEEAPLAFVPALGDFDSCTGYSGCLCGPSIMVNSGTKAFKHRPMAPHGIYREKFTPIFTAEPQVPTWDSLLSQFA